MNKSIIFIALSALFIFLAISSASALIISSVDSDVLAPGKEGELSIILKNNFDHDVEDVSLSLQFSVAIPITAADSSESSVDEIRDGDKETFSFLLRADADAKAGDYSIPYVITYKNLSSPKTGTVSVRVMAKPELELSVNAQTPVVGEKSKVTLKIVNRGLGDAKFVSVKIIPEGFTLLSEDNSYIGTIDSDDFNSASFDVIFRSKNAMLQGTLEYSDLDNREFSENIALPLKVYTPDEAVQQGIIPKSNTSLYVIIIVILIVLWLIWRAIRKRNRLRKSREAMNAGR